jgi:hypothetical protein
MSKDKTEYVGTLHDKNTLFMRGFFGDAEQKNGPTYELSCTGLGGPGAPIISNKQTGLIWTIGWAELIQLAKAAGIDGDKPENVKPSQITKMQGK